MKPTAPQTVSADGARRRRGTCAGASCNRAEREQPTPEASDCGPPEDDAPHRRAPTAGWAAWAGLGPGALLGALSFLTILPLGRAEPPARLGRAYFPLAGLVVGAASGGVFLGTSQALPRPAAAALALGAAAIVTGGLHLDGLTDSADGLLGGATQGERLEIMRDPRAGAFGIAALVLVVAAEIGCLTALSPLAGFVALFLSAGLSRLAMLGVLVTLPYVRETGLGRAAAGPLAALDLVVGGVCVSAASLLAGPRAALAAGAAGLGALVVATIAARRIGGATGDVYGAVVEIAQLGALLAFAVAL